MGGSRPILGLKSTSAVDGGTSTCSLKLHSCFTHIGCDFGRHCLFRTGVHHSNSSHFTGKGR